MRFMTEGFGGDSHACIVCGRVLEQLIGDGPRLYRHSAVDEPADHLPVAARVDVIPEQVQFRCDFCLGEPVTHTLVVDVELSLPSAGVLWDTEWAMCRPCTELVLANEWLNLRRRAFAGFESVYGRMSEGTKMEMRIVYRDLREHLVMIYAEPVPSA